MTKKWNSENLPTSRSEHQGEAQYGQSPSAVVVTGPGNRVANVVGMMELERNSTLKTGAFGFAERRHASPTEVLEDLVMRDCLRDHRAELL